MDNDVNLKYKQRGFRGVVIEPGKGSKVTLVLSNGSQKECLVHKLEELFEVVPLEK